MGSLLLHLYTLPTPFFFHLASFSTVRLPALLSSITLSLPVSFSLRLSFHIPHASSRALLSLASSSLVVSFPYNRFGLALALVLVLVSPVSSPSRSSFLLLPPSFTPFSLSLTPRMVAGFCSPQCCGAADHQARDDGRDYPTTCRVWSRKFSRRALMLSFVLFPPYSLRDATPTRRHADPP